MAEVFGIVSGVVGILAGAELAYQKVKSIKGLPEAFAEVALRVPLAQQILRDIEAQSREASAEAAKAILPIVKSCEGNAETLKTTLEKLDPGESTSVWDQHKGRYMSLFKSRGKKGRVEDLMKKILEDIYTLASHRSINAASSEQLDSLKEAIEKVGEVKNSIADDGREDGTRLSISHGGQGPMSNQVGNHNTTWNNFGSGNINNISGDAHFGATVAENERLEAEKRLAIAKERLAIAEKKRGILCNLNCPSYEDHKNWNRVAMPRTCAWFTNHPTFQSWMNSPRERFLWVSADPGCGKSVLAKHLIDDKLKASKSKVIYFFFKAGSDDQDNAASALKCLLDQLLKDESSLFTDEVLKNFEELGKKRLSAFSDLWNIFAKISPNIVNTICIMDALDECEPSEWSRMAKALGDLCETGKMGMRFILFSRPYEHVRRSIREGRVPHINLHGEDEAELCKISAEIDFVIKRRVKNLARELKLTLKEEEQVIERLTKVRNRTYLWVHVICDMLENCGWVENNSLDRFLDRLPKTVEDAYEKILHRKTDENKAKTLLHIIVAAARPLSVEEMEMAMIVNGQQSFNGEFSIKGNNVFVERMRNTCGLFVVVFQGNVHLIHQTAREFLIRDTPSGRGLEWEACLNLQESNRVITRICVWYLLNIGFRCAPFTKLEDTTALDDDSQKRLILFDYASRHWASHYRQSNLEENSDLLGQHIFQLCDTSWTGCTTWYAHFLKHNQDKYLPLSPNPLQLASCLGIDHTARRILVESNYTLHAKDDDRLRPPLYLAAASGSHNIVIMLLRTMRKNKVYRKRINIGPALEVSSDHGHESIVEALLQASGTKLRWNDAQSALEAAARNGYDPIVRSILSSKPVSVLWRRLWFERTNSLSGRYFSPLECAASKGHLTTVKILLDSGKTKPDGETRIGLTPLSSAARRGDANVVSMLLETGRVNINSRNDIGYTPLSYAAKKGHADIVKLLLDTGQVDINSRDRPGDTPLSHAVKEGHPNVAEMLLDTGQVDINLRDWFGCTPLIYAAHKGYTKVVRMLLDTDKVRVNVQDNLGDTPLLLAVESGNWKVVEMLLATGKVDTNARNTADMTPLVVALMKRDLRVANLLLASGNIHENRLQPERILFAAANDDLSTLIPLYEEWNADLEMTSETLLQEYSIMVALANESKNVFEYLLDAGNLDVNSEFNWGSSRESDTTAPLRTKMDRSTLLVRAVKTAQLDIVRILLSRKASVEAKSSTNGATALSTAVVLRQLDIVKTLLQVEKLDLTLICQNGLTTRLIARELYDYFPRSEDEREIVLLLNDHIRAMPDGGKALRNLERRIIEEKNVQLRNPGMDSDDSDAES